MNCLGSLNEIDDWEDTRKATNVEEALMGLPIENDVDEEIIRLFSGWGLMC